MLALYDMMCGYVKKDSQIHILMNVIFQKYASCCQLQSCCSGTFPFEQPEVSQNGKGNTALLLFHLFLFIFFLQKMCIIYINLTC